MKVVLVTPFYHQPRGNTVTVQRISEGLTRLGVTTEIISLTGEEDLPSLPSADLIHGFNAYQFYQYIERIPPLDCPYLITITGTDLNHDLFDERRREKVIRSLTNAKAIHVFNKEARNILWQEVPSVKEKTVLIPQGIVTLPMGENQIKKEEGTFLFLLPAGIRRVKNLPAAISMLVSLRREKPQIRLWIIGPIIEETEGIKVMELIKQNQEWVHYLGQVPHREMGAIYQCADAVLNTSLSEGQSSSILEAMSQGIPVLVSDNKGNRDIVSHGTVGFVYRDEQEFVSYVRLLLEDSELRRKMGRQGREYVQNHHSTEKEIENLLAVYRKIL